MRLTLTLARLLTVVLLTTGAACAQGTAPALMLSDIHFDPFHNPRIAPQLRAAPIEQWPAILDAAASLKADADLAALQLECHSPGLDADWALLKTTLAAAHDAEPHPLFVTLSGDLLAHQFPCRFHHGFAQGSPEELAAFSAKTVAFVAMELRQTFPHLPVYVALGNNDSGCGDYDETPGSSFMQSASTAMTAGLGPGAAAKSRGKFALEFSPEGDYSLKLPPPLQRGRLIVLQDIYDSSNFKTCAGVPDRTPSQAQIAWLRSQLAAARTHKEQVWVMGHIPPGIDVFKSFSKYVLRPADLCSAQPQPFLSDTALADTLLDYADVIRLALFAHTHMDEVRLLHRDGADSAAAVPIKLVPSVSPIFGNHPAFLVAAINPRTLTLADWKTVVSPGSEGSAAPWTIGYRFSTAYGMPDLSAASAEKLAAEFTSDRSGKAAHSSFYRDHFYAGGVRLYALGLEQIWPAYACAVREDRVEAFHDCLCPAAAPAKP